MQGGASVPSDCGRPAFTAVFSPGRGGVGSFVGGSAHVSRRRAYPTAPRALADNRTRHSSGARARRGLHLTVLLRPVPAPSALRRRPTARCHCCRRAGGAEGAEFTGAAARRALASGGQRLKRAAPPARRSATRAARHPWLRRAVRSPRRAPVPVVPAHAGPGLSAAPLPGRLPPQRHSCLPLQHGSVGHGVLCARAYAHACCARAHACVCFASNCQ